MTIECYNQISLNCPQQRSSFAIGPFLKAIWQRFKTHRANIRQRKVDRDAFKRLLSLDETQLKDIGLTKYDVLWASQLPLSKNASLELEKHARGKV